VVYGICVSVQRTSVGLYEDTHNHGDVCTAHGTCVESSHPVRTTLTKASVSAETGAKPSRDATRQTSKQSTSVAAASAAVGSSAADVVGVGAVDWVSSSLSLTR